MSIGASEDIIYHVFDGTVSLMLQTRLSTDLNWFCSIGDPVPKRTSCD